MSNYFEKLKENGVMKDLSMKGVMLLVIFAVSFLLFSMLAEDKDGRKQVISQDGTNVYLSDDENEIKNKEELRLENILSKIAGVGKVEVMINYKDDDTTAVYWNSTGNSDENNGKNLNVTGVIVVAEGGNDITVQTKIFDAVMSIYQIPSAQICVYVMN